MHFLGAIHILGPENWITSQQKKPRESSTNCPAIRPFFSPNEEANVPVPTITHDYNYYKVGVDMADQYIIHPQSPLHLQRLKSQHYEKLLPLSSFHIPYYWPASRGCWTSSILPALLGQPLEPLFSLSLSFGCGFSHLIVLFPLPAPHLV